MSFFCFHLCRGEGSPFKCRVSWLKWLLLRCGQCKVGIQVYPGSNPNPWWISRSSKTISPKFNVNKVCPSKCALEPSWISAFENHRYQTSSSNYIWEKEWLWLWCTEFYSFTILERKIPWNQSFFCKSQLDSERITEMTKMTLMQRFYEDPQCGKMLQKRDLNFLE